MVIKMEEHKIIIISSTGKCIGLIKGYDVFNLNGKKIVRAKPKTTLQEIVENLIYEKVTE